MDQQIAIADVPIPPPIAVRVARSGVAQTALNNVEAIVQMVAKRPVPVLVQMAAIRFVVGHVDIHAVELAVMCLQVLVALQEHAQELVLTIVIIHAHWLAARVVCRVALLLQNNQICQITMK